MDSSIFPAHLQHLLCKFTTNFLLAIASAPNAKNGHATHGMLTPGDLSDAKNAHATHDMLTSGDLSELIHHYLLKEAATLYSGQVPLERKREYKGTLSLKFLRK